MYMNNVNKHLYISEYIGLYTGFLSTLTRDLPYFALQLGFYDNIRDALTKKLSNRSENKAEIGHKFKLLNALNNPAAIDLMSGISAGFLTGFLTNPMDVGKFYIYIYIYICVYM
jgi:hypothetical protein